MIRFFFNDLSITLLILGGIAILPTLPTLLYITFKNSEDEGEWTGIIGYYIIKLLRKLR